MSKKEEKAREYADKEVRRYHKHSGVIEKYGMERARMLSENEAWELEEAYEAGWDEALKIQWVSVNERMPEPNKDVLLLTDLGMVMNGCYDGNVWMQMDGYWGSAYSSIDKCWNVIAWMPIPPFDEILKDK